MSSLDTAFEIKFIKNLDKIDYEISNKLVSGR